ncbi:hypothetical protein ACFQMM_07205 [Saliphagus sp. GCM10025308]
MLEVEVHPVNLAVAGDDLVGEVLVLLFERVETHSEAFHDDLAHVTDVRSKFQKLFLVGGSGHARITTAGVQIPYVRVSCRRVVGPCSSASVTPDRPLVCYGRNDYTPYMRSLYWRKIAATTRFTGFSLEACQSQCIDV